MARVTPSPNVAEVRFTAEGSRVGGFMTVTMIVDRPGSMSFSANTAWDPTSGYGFILSKQLVPTGLPIVVHTSSGDFPTEATLFLQPGAYSMLFFVQYYGGASADDWVLRTIFTPQ